MLMKGSLINLLPPAQLSVMHIEAALISLVVKRYCLGTDSDPVLLWHILYVQQVLLQPLYGSYVVFCSLDTVIIDLFFL